ncbi:hypothetical protein [Neobacillus sp. NPDC093127]|uniref:hypothetical protein n=1 Tax=Neobacillus sp. NPDC093127 TaxID=3364296 RepID=UPI00382537F8
MTEQNTNQVAEKEEAKTPVVQQAGSNYITQILEETKNGFIEANQGLDLDFVRMGDWLSVNKKGNFQEKDDEAVQYGDTIDVVVGFGEQRWSLWGLEGSPEDGQLIVAHKTKDEAEEALSGWLNENPQAADRYSAADISLRYMAYVVPVDSLTPDDFPKIYLMSFSPTDTIVWGRFAFDVYKGKFKVLNIPSRTAVNKIVVRLTTEEKKSRSNASQSWIGLNFKPVGLFKPEDYGIVTAQA